MNWRSARSEFASALLYYKKKEVCDLLTPSLIIQLLVTGVAYGFIYSLVGIEFTLIWNTTDVVNFAHDKMATIGAYVFGGTFILGLQWGIVPAIIGSILVLSLWGLVVSKIIFIPLRNIPEIFTVMATLLLGKICMEGCRLIWGNVPFKVKGFLNGTYQIGSIVISRACVTIIISSIIIVVALQFFLYKTKTGKAMRCVSQNKMAAEVMGIDVHNVISISVIISMVICCLIGILTIPLLTIQTTMTDMIGLKGFAAAVIGGFGYLPGSIYGGLMIGILENVAAMIIPSVYKDVVSFIVLIVFMLFRPKGLTGKSR